MQNFRNFIHRHYGTLETSALALLLLLLEKSMESEFTCPSEPVFSRVYTAVFFLMPAMVLGVLGYKLSGVKCKGSCICCLKTICGPLIWFCILLSDGRYVTCFSISNARQISQIFGIISFSLLLILSFVMEELCCCRHISALYFREKYEEKMLKELEEGLRSKAKKQQTEIAEDLVIMVTDESFAPQQANWLKNLENLICTEKNKIRERFKEGTIISEEQRRHAAALRDLLHGQRRGDERRSSI
ncbi:uncharacterized protein LOC122923359 [Bufo gargarizans]|uniref:uncharacterized protein LOC122923359 n=1 Tax=Bufo gargarizans TaxID=30331 RepID=UPI001CF2E3EB|nr:uncharacterized protein LOC122923359 [Bufo gargarizans]